MALFLIILIKDHHAAELYSGDGALFRCENLEFTLSSEPQSHLHHEVVLQLNCFASVGRTSLEKEHSELGLPWIFYGFMFRGDSNQSRSWLLSAMI